MTDWRGGTPSAVSAAFLMNQETGRGGEGRGWNRKKTNRAHGAQKKKAGGRKGSQRSLEIEKGVFFGASGPPSPPTRTNKKQKKKPADRRMRGGDGGSGDRVSFVSGVLLVRYVPGPPPRKTRQGGKEIDTRP